MTQPITKEAENQLLEQISKVITAVDEGGLSPTDAVTKVAKEAGIQPNTIRLIARSYNTGAQESQRKSASSILDKFASFPIADGDKAVEAIYPKSEDTPAQSQAKSACWDGYNRAPDFSGLAETRYREKVAHAPMPALIDNPVPAYEESSEQRMKRAWNLYEKEKRAHEEVRFQATAARDTFLLAIGQLGNYFKEGGDVSFEQAKWVAENYLGKSGATMMKVIEHRNYNPGKKVDLSEDCSDEAKEAAAFLDELHSPKQAAVQPPQHIDWDRAPYTLMQALTKSAQTMLAAQQARIDSETKLTKVAEGLRPFDLARSPRPTSIIPQQEKAGFGSFFPIAGGIGLKSVLDKALTPKPTSELVDDQWMELEDPEHENSLRKIRAQAMISDFMANDEVISGYDQEEVLRAYNEIAQMTPRASTQPGAMRPLIRRRLQGHVEPFEAEQATNIEKGIAQTSTPTPDTQRLGNAPSSILG